ncbi:hypothetical protein [Paenibacillus apis]|uniref:Uncharacterized protein n=1 Tax=Paenibacillus apis TaxID=1792174 RepID=A0A919Y955_9BACL|nr:hypothetical protein [Paenibacillus apis]GIO44660.1 hypothetical protein J41TS4_44180 [Paenibacillus apis]
MANQEATPKTQENSRLFSSEGKPVRVLSTSLGIALLANAFLIPGEPAMASGSGTSEPTLVEWSSEEVKAYFDQNVDWSLPIQTEEQSGQEETSGGTTIVNHYGGYGGFGWDDLLLYHLLFNSGTNYSSSTWHKNNRGYYPGTTTPYTPRTYSSGSFQSKPVAGSVVPPKTSASTKGSIIRRSTSSTSGGIGGNSGSLGSSSSSKSSSGTSKGFFGG